MHWRLTTTFGRLLALGLAVLPNGCSKYWGRVAVPPFQIRIVLSEPARSKLQSSGEVIEGIVDFHGDGVHKPGEDTSPFRAVYLGSYHFKTTDAGVVSISRASISKEAYQRLTDTDYYYTINVASGRRVFKDNILSGGADEGHISNAIKAPIEIRCDLISR